MYHIFSFQLSCSKNLGYPSARQQEHTRKIQLFQVVGWVEINFQLKCSLHGGLYNLILANLLDTVR